MRTKELKEFMEENGWEDVRAEIGEDDGIAVIVMTAVDKDTGVETWIEWYLGKWEGEDAEISDVDLFYAMQNGREYLLDAWEDKAAWDHTVWTDAEIDEMMQTTIDHWDETVDKFVERITPGTEAATAA